MGDRVADILRPILCLLVGLTVQPTVAARPLPLAPAETLLVTPAWLAAHLDDPAITLIHADRTREVYDAGHLPRARFLALSAIVISRNGLPRGVPPVERLDSVLGSVGISDSGRIVIYGDPLAAGRLFFTLDLLGLGDRTSMLDGGLRAWRARGGPLTTQLPPPIRAPLSARPRDGILVNADWVREHLHDTSFALIDARSEAEFRGDVPGEGVVRPGHIPGAFSLYWLTTLEPGEGAALKDAEVLRTLFRRGGAQEGKTIIAYCSTGVRSSWLYFVARYLGFQVRLYDGSFIEWSDDDKLPVEAGR
jgi:thiosulfate/3-mercaptopyruvate sulfurtransferase